MDISTENLINTLSAEPNKRATKDVFLDNHQQPYANYVDTDHKYDFETFIAMLNLEFKAEMQRHLDDEMATALNNHDYNELKRLVTRMRGNLNSTNDTTVFDAATHQPLTNQELTKHLQSFENLPF